MSEEQANPNAFQLQVPVEELRKKKLFVATPMYGGQCAGMFTRSIADLSAMCNAYGIPLQLYFLFNESLITRARNYCVDEFMRSGATHMMFIDSDIGFDPRDVLALLALQNDDKGFADENPSNLERFVGDYVFNPKGGQQSIPINQPVEVLEIGTGFMMIRRRTFEKFEEARPDLLYRPDHVRTEAFDGSRKIMMYFQAEIDPKSERYLSEDYWFCQKIQELNMQTWFCPWMRLNHVGSYIFGGSLADLAAVGASATADAGLLEKNKSRAQQKIPQKRKS
jgi:hypothetical protein